MQVLQTNSDAPGLLTPEQTARFLAISPRKLHSMTQAKELPCIRMGRALRYRRCDLDTWLAKLAAESVGAVAI